MFVQTSRASVVIKANTVFRRISIPAPPAYSGVGPALANEPREAKR